MNNRFKFRAWDTWKKKYRFIYFEGYCEDTANFSEYLICKSRYVVEQCTGLKDKHDKWIYEGDIVRVYYDKCIVNWIGWGGHFLMTSACTDPLTLEDDLSYQFGEVSKSEIEVIGNIHENKNLLEADK